MWVFLVDKEIIFMIIIKIQGGLGNQLFQYAFGRTIERKYAKKVAYDISSYGAVKKNTPRAYHLDKFNTPVTIATKEEILNCKYPFGSFSKITYIIKKLSNKLFFKRYHISFEPEFLESIKNTDSAYLEGYWQSFRYIEPALPDLKKEVTLKVPPSAAFEVLKAEISQSDSVAIHIRRGDYVQGGVDLQVLDIVYYKNAMNLVSQKIEDAKYYIFTDDAVWAKENLNFLEREKITYVSDFTLADYEELVLIAQCKHVIVANSSFSWWGAMLNQNKNAMIICPKDWKNVFLKNDMNLCPEKWIRI